MSFSKVWLPRSGKTLLALIFVPLFAIMFFAMPVELAVCSWQLATTQATTTGVVVSSEVSSTTGRGRHTRSYVTYRYEVNGAKYEGKRVAPGFIDGPDSGLGGELGRSTSRGDQILVYYSAGNPKFSFLQYGWPSPAIGFSLFVAGILTTGLFGWNEPGSRKVFWFHALSRALPITGFATMIFGEKIVPPSELWQIVAIHGAATLGVAVYLKFKYRNRPSRAADFQRAPRWKQP